jgi:hypothetical protein
MSTRQRVVARADSAAAVRVARMRPRCRDTGWHEWPRGSNLQKGLPVAGDTRRSGPLSLLKGTNA